MGLQTEAVPMFPSPTHFHVGEFHESGATEGSVWKIAKDNEEKPCTPGSQAFARSPGNDRIIIII